MSFKVVALPQERDALEEAVQRGAAGKATGLAMREWELRARLNVMVRRGEIAPDVVLHSHTVVDDLGRRTAHITAYYIRLKPAPKRWPLRAIIAAHIAGMLAAVTWLVWESRFVIMYTVAALAGIALLWFAYVVLRTVSGQTCSCVIHGPECRG
jgi:hypothetical protein